MLCLCAQVRPLINKETLENAGSCIVCNPCGNQNQLRIGNDKHFTYDYVIGPEEGQQRIYDTAISGLLEGFFNGYNSCILAYGQTVRLFISWPSSQAECGALGLWQDAHYGEQ